MQHYPGTIEVQPVVEELAADEEPVVDEELVVAEEPVAAELVVVDPMDALRASEAVVACLQAEVARQDLINDAQGALLRATRLLARDDEL